MTRIPDEPDEDDRLEEDDELEEDDQQGGIDLGDLLARAQSMQQQLLVAQAAAADRVVEGQAGGGAVKVQVTGGLDFRGVTIDPSAVDPTDVEMLEDLVLAAVRDAVGQVNALNQEALGGFGGSLGGLLP